MKTIITLVDRGIIAKNFLTSGAIFELVKKDFRVVVCVLPEAIEDFKAEYSHPQIVFEPIPPSKKGKLRQRVFTPLLRNSLFNKTKRISLRYGTGKVQKTPLPVYAVLWLFYFSISKIPGIQTFFQWLEYVLFRDPEYGSIYDAYQPDIALQLNLFGKSDGAFIKEAAHRSIPTFVLPKGWDTLDRLTLHFKPDVMLVQTHPMKEQAITFHKYNESAVKVIGFPNYDLASKKAKFLTREDTCSRLGIPFDRPYIVYASEGPWSKNEGEHLEKIAGWIQDGTLDPLSLVIRPYFSDVRLNKYESLKKYDFVHIDEAHRLRDYYPDRWDPTKEELYLFFSMLAHSAMVICVRSTLSIDAAVMDKPCINLGYRIYIDEKGSDETPHLYSVGFYQDILHSGGVTLVKSDEELLEALRGYLEDPSRDAEGRAKLVRRMCGSIDGRSGERLAEIIDESLEEQFNF